MYSYLSDHIYTRKEYKYEARYLDLKTTSLFILDLQNQTYAIRIVNAEKVSID